MTKQEQIESKKTKPFEVGDYVEVKTSYTEEKSVWVGRGKNKELVTDKTEKEFTALGNIVEISNDLFKISNVFSGRSASWVTSPVGVVYTDRFTYDECTMAV